MCHNTLSANLNAGRAALIIRIKMYIYVAAVKLRRCDKIWFSFSLPGFEWVLVHPGIQKSISGYWLDICLQSYTCLLLIHQVRVSIRIGFHEFKA